MKSKIDIEEKRNPTMHKKKEGSSPQLNVRGRTRVKGSVLRPISQVELQSTAKATSKVMKTQAGREKVVAKSVLNIVGREKENSIKSANMGDETKKQPVTRKEKKQSVRVKVGQE